MADCFISVYSGSNMPIKHGNTPAKSSKLQDGAHTVIDMLGFSLFFYASQFDFTTADTAVWYQSKIQWRIDLLSF